jgi:hypothetical protein
VHNSRHEAHIREVVDDGKVSKTWRRLKAEQENL